MPYSRRSRVASYRKGYRNAKRKARGKYSRTRSFQRRVKRVLMKNSETKYYESGQDNVQLWHNRGFALNALPPFNVSSIPLLFNFWPNVQQGVGRSERVGDKITPRGMSIKLFLANKFDRPNVMHRVIVARLPKEYAGGVTGSIFDPFQNNACGNRMLLHADHDKGVKFLYDRIHRTTSNQAIGGGYPEFNSGVVKEGTKCIKLWIKRKTARPIVFNQNLQQIVNSPIAVYVIPYEQYSTLESSNVSSLTYVARIYYKDI
jgi:hypothetical protein